VPVHVTDFPVINVHVDEFRRWYNGCGSRFVINFIGYLRDKSWKPECVLSFNMGWRIKFTNFRQPMLKLKTPNKIDNKP
jgi:hypothetical protein